MDLRLTIELVPSTAWNHNLRDLLTRDQWDTLRRLTYKHYRYRCGICQVSDTTLYCHEIWQYDDDHHIQKLAGLIALCKWCHHCKHMGYAGILALDGELDLTLVVQHFLQVNGCSREDYQAHRAQAFQTHRERSQHEWTLDIGKYARLIHPEQGNGRAHLLLDEENDGDDIRPTQATGGWLYADCGDAWWYPPDTPRSGKWLVFLDNDAIDDYWRLIQLSLSMWRLGRVAKVSTGLAPAGKQGVICVYTYDYADYEDVMRVRRELSSIGTRRRIPYKSNAQTRAGHYGQQWAYNESGKAPAHVHLGSFEPIYRM